MSGKSDVDICSDALLRLGEQGIASLSEDSDRARTCASVYPSIRDAVLSMHPWRFSTGKIQLARLTSTPVNEWTYAFQLPSDMLAGPHAVFKSTDVGAVPFQAFEKFQDQIYSDEQIIVIDYRFRPTELKFPPWFTELLTLALAASIGMSVTDKPTLVKIYEEKAWGTAADNFRGGWYAIAIGQNASNNQNTIIQDDSLVSTRFDT